MSLLSCAALALGVGAPASSASAAGDPWERFHAFRGASAVELRASGFEASELEAARERLSRRLERAGKRLVAAGASDATALRVEVWRTAGSGASGTDKPAGDLPYGLELPAEGGFRYHGADYQGAGDGLVLSVDDPDRGPLPLTLIVANRAAFAARLLGEVEPVWRAGFTTFRGGEPERRGSLAGSGRPGSAPFERFSAARDSARGGALRRYTDSVRSTSAGPDAGAQIELYVDAAGAAEPQAAGRADAYLAAVEAAFERLGRWCPPAERPVVVCAHTTAESLHGARGTLAPYSLSNLNRRVQVSWLPDLFDDAGAGAAAARAREALGAPALDVLLDAVGIEAADRWWGQALEPWVAHLVQAGLSLTPAELMRYEPRGATAVSRSPHRVLPQLALFVRYVFEERGAEGVRALWSGQLDAADAELTGGFAARLERLAESWAERLDQRRAGRRRLLDDGRLRRGIAFLPGGSGSQQAAGSGAGLYGYASVNARASLDRARSAGANALTLDAHAYDRVEEPRFAIGGPTGRASVSDFELSAAASAAAARGMSVLLKPHLLASQSGGFLGQTAITQVADWGVFFGRYESFLEHYALLGELLGVEILSLGSALPRATRTLGNFAPEDLPARDRRRAGWTQLCAFARRVFSGGLTYAALDGTPGHAFEVVGIEFWDQLDFVGVELFGPPILADNAGTDDALVRSASDETLMLGIRARMGRADREARDRGLPVLFTAIGFPSTVRGASHPASVTGELDLDLQQRSYSALRTAMAQLLRGKSRIAGFYLWSWSADPGAGGLRDRGHTPQNKPAEAVLEQLLR